MKTLTIQDLAHTERLDRSAMAAVRGGTNMGSPSYEYGDVTIAPVYDSSIHAVQNLFQAQSVTNAVANGAAFVEGLQVHNDTSQIGQNTIIKR